MPSRGPIPRLAVLVAAAGVLVFAVTLQAADRGLVNTSASPHVVLRSVDLDDARWTDGFWAQRFELCRRVMVPNMKRVMELPGNAATLRNFRIAAGLEKGTFSGTNWGDGDCYKWLEAVACVYAVTRDEKLDRTMDELIAVIAKAQEPDGYIATQIQLTDKQRWQDLRHHELYNMGHLMTAACVHHRATGKDSFLRVARKLGDYLYTVFQPRPRKLAHFGFNPSNIMGAAELYRTTGDRRYLELARTFVDMRGSASGGSDQNQARVPLRRETEAVGHAVTAAYLWCGAADVYAETGDKALRGALERLWSDVTGRKMYLTGAIGALHHGESIRHDSVHEAFGRAYELPSRTAYNETCANIANAMWSWRMLQISGEARYADVTERVLYNSMLSGVGIDGTDFFYTNPLRRCGPDVPLLRNDTPARWPDTTKRPAPRCFCCPPNVLRTIAGLHGWAYGVSDRAVWVHLCGGSVLRTELPDGTAVGLEQQTDYPWDGRIRITVKQAPDEPMAVMLRIPGWAEGAAIQVNGQPAGIPAKPGTYASVRRKWSPGDVIELDLPMNARLVEAHPLVEQLRNQVAVMRGPIVYCLESPDLPEGVKVGQVTIPAGAEFSPHHEKDLLGGVTVLRGKARLAEDGNWNGRLYRARGSEAGKTIDVTLVAYYAWANRGPSEMTVWMPVLQP